MKRSVFLLIALVLTVTLVLPACKAAPPAETYEWKFISPAGVAAWPQPEFREFADEVGKATGGVLSITVYTRGEHPFEWTEGLMIIKEGYAPISWIEVGAAAGMEPTFNLISLPGMLPVDAMDAAEMFDRALKEVYSDILDKWNAVPLLYHVYPPTVFHLKDAFVTDFESLRGKKIRAYSPLTLSMVELVGGIPVAMSFGEVPTALMTGIIDGLVTEVISTYPAGLHDMVKYTTNIPITSSQGMVLISRDALAELDDATRSTLMEVAEKWNRELWVDMPLVAQEMTEKAKAEYGAQFMEPNEAFLDEIMERTEAEIWPYWIGEAGPDAPAMVEALLKIKAEVEKR